MMDEGVELYFIDAAESALASAEMMLQQKRKAKAQEYLMSAMYYSAKVDNWKFPDSFHERLTNVQKRSW